MWKTTVTDPSITPEQLVRIQFYQTVKESKDSKPELVFFPAVQCNELYKDEMESDEFKDFYKTEFANDDWYCPQVKNFTVFNNPFLYDAGSNFVMTINDCTVATEKEESEGV